MFLARCDMLLETIDLSYIVDRCTCIKYGVYVVDIVVSKLENLYQLYLFVSSINVFRMFMRVDLLLLL